MTKMKSVVVEAIKRVKAAGHKPMGDEESWNDILGGLSDSQIYTATTKALQDSTYEKIYAGTISKAAKDDSFLRGGNKDGGLNDGKWQIWIQEVEVGKDKDGKPQTLNYEYAWHPKLNRIAKSKEKTNSQGKPVSHA